MAGAGARAVSDGTVDLEDLALGEGGVLLVKRALAMSARVRVRGSSPTLAIDLGAWARAEGHVLAGDTLERGAASRWAGAQRAGRAAAGGVVDRPPGRWGLAARGALVEAGAPDLGFTLADRQVIWADEAERLYAQAAAAQWDPATAIPWDAPIEHAPEIEDAVVQVMTYLIENETAALLVPARFLGRLHPHFREVMQLLAIQTADEARHVEVFTRRALLRRAEPGSSTAGGQASLATLLDEPDFALAAFLLSVLGEGSFLALLWFLRDHAPDPITRTIATLAAQDEARHVAFGLAHLSRHVAEDPTLRARLSLAVQRRHAALAHTTGLNADVLDALQLLAAGSLAPAALRRAHGEILSLLATMDSTRQAHLRRLGFAPEAAETLSSLHTRNFM
ncbi:MAG TPA: hypothetical protein VM261_26185 [Kofleriaceae bacterium]|nr:hypothetical protein [Kofleriaceae bacterium]